MVKKNPFTLGKFWKASFAGGESCRPQFGNFAHLASSQTALLLAFFSAQSLGLFVCVTCFQPVAGGLFYLPQLVSPAQL